MYGGVAQRYIRWKMVGEPYKKGKFYYVKMEHPVTKFPTEVRWYTDKAHADLMPTQTTNTHTAIRRAAPKFVGSPYGFSSADDYVIAIRDRDINDAEKESIFHRNWERGGKWKWNGFFGGIWFAPKDAAELPAHLDERCFRVTWPEFVAAGQAHTRKYYERETGFWFNIG